VEYPFKKTYIQKVIATSKISKSSMSNGYNFCKFVIESLLDLKNSKYCVNLMGHFWKCLFSLQKGWANDDNMLFF